MTPDEHDMLIRVDERINEMHERHLGCKIPERVSNLESKKDRIEAIVAVILVLVSLGRVWDVYEFFRQLVLNIH